MTREEYNEFRYIRSCCRKWGRPSAGSMYTIRTDAGAEYKSKLHELYTTYGLHPADVRVDRHYFDEKERIIYISGGTYTGRDGKLHSWEELYTEEEKRRFAAALL